MLLLHSLQINKLICRKYSAEAISAVRKIEKKLHAESWKSVVGLEVHAQIASTTKLFSGSGTSFNAPLNSSVSFFDASIPGTLPVLNRKCVEAAVKTALALSCRINEVSMFDRKHYFYADLPAGYQITQQRAALANDGKISFPVITPGKKLQQKTVRLLQLQLEQDSGKSLHDEALKKSMVDLNRAGLPLMELVFAPDLENGEEAASLVKELMLILKSLRTCSCKMEEGALRVDANISIHREGEPFGVRTEVKNIGSVRSISQAITFEIQRQLDIVSKGQLVTNETRAWDADNKCTIAMRDKEVLQDYRFMPEPNLTPLWLNMQKSPTTQDHADNLVCVATLAAELPELPEDTRQHLIKTYKLSPETAIILVNEPILLQHFKDISSNLPALPKKIITNFLTNEVLKHCNKFDIDLAQCLLTTDHLIDILKSVHAEEINLLAAEKLIQLIHDAPHSTVGELIASHNLRQISDPRTIADLCERAILNQPKAVHQFKKGKSKALFAIAGEVSRLSEQRANMKLAVACLEKLLKT